MDTHIFVGEFNTGAISVRHESYDGSKLGALRFAARHAQSFRNESFTRLRAEHQTKPQCHEDFVDRDGLVLRAVVCLRAYKKLPQLYDVSVLVATLDQTAGRRAGPLRRAGRELRQRAAAGAPLPRGLRMGEVNRPTAAGRGRGARPRRPGAPVASRCTRWPLRIGRALDNDLVLADPHVAPHHLRIDAGRRRAWRCRRWTRATACSSARAALRAGERAPLPDDGDAARADRRPHAAAPAPARRMRCAPELPLAAAATRARRFGPTLAAGAGAAAGAGLQHLARQRPRHLRPRARRRMLLTAVDGRGGLVRRCGRCCPRPSRARRRFGWHLQGVPDRQHRLAGGRRGCPSCWPSRCRGRGSSDFGFVATLRGGRGGAVLPPARRRAGAAAADARRGAAGASSVGVGLTLWFNLQRSDRLGAELYMSHLFPPALRAGAAGAGRTLRRRPGRAAAGARQARPRKRRWATAVGRRR